MFSQAALDSRVLYKKIKNLINRTDSKDKECIFTGDLNCNLMSLHDNDNGDIKGTWKILKQTMNKEAKESDIQKIHANDEDITDKQQILETFNEYFGTIHQKLNKDIPKPSKSSLDYIS